MFCIDIAIFSLFWFIINNNGKKPNLYSKKNESQFQLKSVNNWMMESVEVDKKSLSMSKAKRKKNKC